MKNTVQIYYNILNSQVFMLLICGFITLLKYFSIPFKLSLRNYIPDSFFIFAI